MDDAADNESGFEENGTESIIRLSGLIEELMQDATELTKDLIEGIGAVGGAAALILSIAIIELLIVLANLWRDIVFIAVGGLTVVILFAFGIRMLLKFIELRTKYARLYEIKKELKK